MVIIAAQKAPRIDPTACAASIDYGSLSAEQVKVMDDILSAGEVGADTIAQNLSLQEFDEVISYIGLYYGSTLAHWNVALWREGFALINLDLMQTLEQRKAILDAKIDSVLAKMYEGSDRFKLFQICQYIAATVDYSYSLDDIEPISGLNGKGSCTTYSILFYKMARRIGIKASMCYGTDINHAWNVVELDKKQWFYDVTFFDNIILDKRYIHSETAWGRNFVVNNSFAN